jgi:subtilisin family serine protease
MRTPRGRGRTVVTVRTRIAVLLLGAVALAAAAQAGGPVRRVAQPIRDEYVVVLKPGAAAAVAGANVTSLAADIAHRHGAAVERVFQHALRGFAARMTAAQAAAMAADPRVDYVEEDGAVRLETTQTGATWGIDRIDQRSLPLSTTFSYTNTGLGVTAYVIDTGIRFTHSEFGGRATSGFDAVDGGSADDCNGHGTHVSGTVGGATYGVAKEVHLVAVRVLSCLGAGSNAKVIAGIDWVTGDHAPGTPAVANMSLGSTSTSDAMDAAVRNSIATGVSYVLAAGNGSLIGIPQDACTTSPARVTEAMTVSATNKNDKKPFWANFGDCVDWFAPGVGITSAWKTSDTATATLTGTSMAAPHTTGVAALYLQSHPTATPAEVRDALFAKTTKGIVRSSRSANSHLLFTDY